MDQINDFNVHDYIGLNAIENFLLHSKGCKECKQLYDNFLNKTMNTTCFKEFFIEKNNYEKEGN